MVAIRLPMMAKPSAAAKQQSMVVRHNPRAPVPVAGAAPRRHRPAATCSALFQDDQGAASSPSRGSVLRSAAAAGSSLLLSPSDVADAPVAALASAPARSVVQLYRTSSLANEALKGAAIAERARGEVSEEIVSVDVETCFNVGVGASGPLGRDRAATLAWLLAETFEPDALTPSSSFEGGDDAVVEVGPRLSYASAWSTNAVSVCSSAGLGGGLVERLEPSRRYRVRTRPGAAPLSEEQRRRFASLVHDRMTEQVYARPLESFDVASSSPSPAVVPATSKPVRTIPLLERGREALAEVDAELGLAFDDQDVDFYLDLFCNKLRRDPTDVELFDLAQSNSEHSRHWFFGAKLVLDGEPAPATLMQLVKETLKKNPGNSVIGFKDNSSAIRGGPVVPLLPSTPGRPGPLRPAPRDWDILLTAETHNFPCAVAPYPGAETGAGGRIRDTHATGIGSMMGAATAGYCVGNLRLDADGPSRPGAPSAAAPSSARRPSLSEDPSFEYPPNLAPPLQILIDSSNGASDYGNKFGEPLVAGYTRTFGLRVPSAVGVAGGSGGERREWIKPIMFSGGLGQIDHGHLEKLPPKLGMLVVKIGGPAYRIGMGGGAASSVPSGGGDRAADLDFDAVQRGDAEMAQKLWRVVRACCELGPRNPIQQIHDQGAGGNCNVVKEIIYPLGATVDIRKVSLGDESMSVLEIWGAEYQENDCVLIKPDDRALLESICARERCLMQVIGEIDGSRRVTVVDSSPPVPGDSSSGASEPTEAQRKPVDLDLELVLGDMPPKTFEFSGAAAARAARASSPLVVSEGESPAPSPSIARDALSRVLRLPSVCSKRFLTTKVDRSVTGLVARQQCVGPLQLPLADVAVVARAHTGTAGAATSIGEQPLKGLLDPAAMARLSLAESLTNLVFAPVTCLADVKASVNWMYAAKMGSEGADMFDAAVALRDAMVSLRVACDGGKDSLSMAAAAGGETVMAPGNLVVSAYAPCVDVTSVVTPDLKLPGKGVLVHVDLSGVGGGPCPPGPAPRRLGGSALAHAYGQIGSVPPDVDLSALRAAFDVTQALIKRSGSPVVSGHDVSDGGLATALLEMAFAGNVGIDVSLPAAPPLEASGDAAGNPELAPLFAEEPGLVLEVDGGNRGAADVVAAFAAAGVRASVVGFVRGKGDGRVSFNVGERGGVIVGDVASLRDEWEETSFRLDALQANPSCVEQEREDLSSSSEPVWSLPYQLRWTTPPPFAPEVGASSILCPPSPLATSRDASRPKVAVLREEGSNGDREMAAALHAAGLEPWDVTMSDVLSGRASLRSFRGVVFVGGFSYADVLDSAKGWAGAIRGNESLAAQFAEFRAREDTWSLGVCNGCQLMALLGWVPGGDDDDASLARPRGPAQPRFTHNDSGRFESRWSHVTVLDSPSVLLEGMAGAKLGVWVAHGEGKATFPDGVVLDAVVSKGLAPLRYADPASGEPTERYPANPNGSPMGIAALCSPCGRHLAMMPHPERCFLGWQVPWSPRAGPSSTSTIVRRDGPGPWLKLFQNAAEFCARVK